MIDSFSGEYRWLSNFHVARVALDGAVYPSVEHAYQAAKTTDVVERATIRSTVSPGLAKRLGRTVSLREDWFDIRLTVMRDLIRQKFEHPVFAARLLSTGNEEIVEGNTWGDRFWGVCGGQGDNWLGRILMERRLWLREQSDLAELLA